MNSNLTIKEVKVAKSKMEEAILKAIVEFETNGLTVTEIKLGHSKIMGLAVPITTSVSVPVFIS
jgi:hypothetical protein